MHDWQVNTWRTCAQPVAIRAMPENEIPPAMRVDYYNYFLKPNISSADTSRISHKFANVSIAGYLS